MTTRSLQTIFGGNTATTFLKKFSFLPSSLTKCGSALCLSGFQGVRDKVRDVRDKTIAESGTATLSRTGTGSAASGYCC